MRKSQNSAQRIDGAGCTVYERARDEGIGHVDWDGAKSLFATCVGRDEMEWLASHFAGDRDRRVGVPGEAIDRQSNKGSTARLSWFDRESWRLEARPLRLQRNEREKSAKDRVPWHGTNTTSCTDHGNPESSAGYES